jgi:hypothetical protein
VPGVFCENAGAASEAAIGEPAIDDGRPFASDLEPHDANGDVLGQTLEQEAAATGSDFELDRAGVALEEKPRVDGTRLR